MDNARAQLEESYCEPLAQTLCADRESCGCPQWSETPEGCVATTRQRCLDGLEPYVRDLGRGRLEVREESVALCLSYLTSLEGSCLEPIDEHLSGTCGQLLDAPIILGARCDHSGVTCAQGEGACFGELCEPLGSAEGAPCTEICTLGLFCINGECHALSSSGDSCEGTRDCEAPLRCVQGTCVESEETLGSCEEDRQCPVSHRCDQGVCTSTQEMACTAQENCGYGASCQILRERRCAFGALEGASCRDTEDCDLAFVCSSGSCVPAPQLGEECIDGIRCAPGLACDADTFLCATIPQADEPCALGIFGPRVCAPGLFCLSTGFCSPEAPQQGEPCAADLRCGAGLGCEFRTDGTNICIEPRGVGSSCSNDDVCRSGTFCNFGNLRCEPAYELGESCRNGNECGDRAVCAPSGSGNRFICKELPSLGELCFDECAEELLCVLFEEDEGSCRPTVCQ